MTKRDTPSGLILLPRLRVQNANAVSGPLSWGFPPPSAFLGFVHALNRKLGSYSLPIDDLDFDNDLRLEGVGIISHSFDPQVSSEGYRHRFILSKNPVETKKKIKNGNLEGASFVEEGRAHLEISLLIGVFGYIEGDDEKQQLAERLARAAQIMRIAGGTLAPDRVGKRYQPEFFDMPDSAEEQKKFFIKIRRKLLPGFALLHRQDVLMEQLAELQKENQEATVLDALLNLVQLKVEPIIDDVDPADLEQEKYSGKPTKVEWRARRSKPGWLVPLPVGYGSISEIYDPGTVRKARDNTVPFRFVESLYSLGEWRSPHRIQHPLDLLWYHQAEPDEGLYICDHQKNERNARN